MISPAAVWTLARAEMRTIRRLFRFWFFSAIALFLGVVMYGYYWVIHGLASGWSATIGSLSPQYLMAQTASYQTTALAIGVVFLAFDLRARDRRDRVIEVLDSRPYSNAELVLGRFVGSLVMVLGVAVLALLLIQGFGYLGQGLGWYFGEPALWGSVWAYLFLDAIPALTLYVAFVQTVALVSRNRLIAAVAGLALAIGGFWLSVVLPVYALPTLAYNGGFTGNISELAPQLWTVENILNRMTLTALAAGLLGIAVAVHPRLDDARRRVWGLGGGGLLALGAVLIVSLLTGDRRNLDLVNDWRNAHRARQQEQVVDLDRIRGSVDIRPRGRLDLDLEVRFTSAGSGPTLFSLNPGLVVEAVEDGTGGSFPFTHANGLLEIDLGPAPGETIDLRLRASGRPDVRFAYLDSTIDFERLSYQDAQVVLLGSLNGVLERRFVTLMPGLAWLPRPGALIGVDDPRQRPRDFFELDLEVGVPSGWSIAGPGPGEPVGERLRFQPEAAVPEAALIAGVYDRRTTEVEGVEIEVLFDRRHLRNLNYFADAREAIEERAARYFAAAREIGLPYPYRQLSLVEVPWTLRGYAGGWRMDTAKAPPGVLLIGETSLPTARFDFTFRNPDRFEDREGGLPAAKASGLESFFANDFSGGNILVGGVRNLFLYRTGARGPEALALEALCHNLVNRLVTDGESYFSVHLFDRSMGWTIATVMQEGFSGGFAAGGGSVARGIVNALTDRPEVWDAVLGSSLADLNVEEDPKRAVNAIYLKTSALAAAILDGAGRERTAAMIANLTRDHAGATFDAADLDRAAEEAGIDLAGLVGDFLHDTHLPGFVVSAADLVRLADDDQGAPQYQTRLSVYNGEPTPGLFRLRYAVRSDRGTRWDSSEPVLVPGLAGIELGLVTSSAPDRVLASPYLALNRGEFPIDVPRVDMDRIVQREPFRGTRPSDWRPDYLARNREVIVVDDLDPGFSVRNDEVEAGGLRLRGGLAGYFAPPTETDQGLPVYNLFTGTPSTWSRYDQPASWGRYRRTTALIAKGEGNRRAVYQADLPVAGRWRVELHVPSLSPVPGGGEIRREVRIGGGDGPPSADARGAQVNVSFGLNLGSYDLELRNGGSAHPIDFDAEAAGIGWAVLGDFELASGTVELELSDDTTGNVVAADAVRFLRLDTETRVGDTAVGGGP